MEENQIDRVRVFSEYYRLKNDKVNTDILWSFLAYNRYNKAKLIDDRLEGAVSILDYGCGVGDYGIYFLRRGKKVSFYDFDHMLDFVKFRCNREGLKAEYIVVKDNKVDLNKDYDLYIFGEVLEHLNNPFEVLKGIIEKKPKYIATSSYPFVDNSYFLKDRHSLKAKEQRRDCKEVLQESYKENLLDTKLRLWTRK